MPSPFPGMDPYIEDYEWSDFHVSFHAVLSEILGPIIRPNYVSRLRPFIPIVTRRIY
jgi:hypothetical protein